ncbi:unnamed protein product [Amoebophrya sp. A120]|nr:unnamed protein product [Amoebophrya sp. A120]|eukprot:GSA120T00013390001.1
MLAKLQKSLTRGGSSRSTSPANSTKSPKHHQHDSFSNQPDSQQTTRPGSPGLDSLADSEVNQPQPVSDMPPKYNSKKPETQQQIEIENRKQEYIKPQVCFNFYHGSEPTKKVFHHIFDLEHEMLTRIQKLTKPKELTARERRNNLRFAELTTKMHNQLETIDKNKEMLKKVMTESDEERMAKEDVKSKEELEMEKRLRNASKDKDGQIVTIDEEEELDNENEANNDGKVLQKHVGLTYEDVKLVLARHLKRPVGTVFLSMMEAKDVDKLVEVEDDKMTDPKEKQAKIDAEIAAKAKAGSPLTAKAKSKTGAAKAAFASKPKMSMLSRMRTTVAGKLMGPAAMKENDLTYILSFPISRIKSGEKKRYAPLHFERCMRQGYAIDIPKLSAERITRADNKTILSFGSPREKSKRANRLEGFEKYKEGELYFIAEMGAKYYAKPLTNFEKTKHFWNFDIIAETAKTNVKQRFEPGVIEELSKKMALLAKKNKSVPLAEKRKPKTGLRTMDYQCSVPLAERRESELTESEYSETDSDDSILSPEEIRQRQLYKVPKKKKEEVEEPLRKKPKIPTFYITFGIRERFTLDKEIDASKRKPGVKEMMLHWLENRLANKITDIDDEASGYPAFAGPEGYAEWELMRQIRKRCSDMYFHNKSDVELLEKIHNSAKSLEISWMFLCMREYETRVFGFRTPRFEIERRIAKAKMEEEERERKKAEAAKKAEEERKMAIIRGDIPPTPVAVSKTKSSSAAVVPITGVSTDSLGVGAVSAAVAIAFGTPAASSRQNSSRASSRRYTSTVGVQDILGDGGTESSSVASSRGDNRIELKKLAEVDGLIQTLTQKLCYDTANGDVPGEEKLDEATARLGGGIDNAKNKTSEDGKEQQQTTNELQFSNLLEENLIKLDIQNEHNSGERLPKEETKTGPPPPVPAAAPGDVVLVAEKNKDTTTSTPAVVPEVPTLNIPDPNTPAPATQQQPQPGAPATTLTVFATAPVPKPKPPSLGTGFGNFAGNLLAGAKQQTLGEIVVQDEQMDHKLCNLEFREYPDKYTFFTTHYISLTFQNEPMFPQMFLAFFLHEYGNLKIEIEKNWLPNFRVMPDAKKYLEKLEEEKIQLELKKSEHSRDFHALSTEELLKMKKEGLGIAEMRQKRVVEVDFMRKQKLDKMAKQFVAVEKRRELQQQRSRSTSKDRDSSIGASSLASPKAGSKQPPGVHFQDQKGRQGGAASPKVLSRPGSASSVSRPGSAASDAGVGKSSRGSLGGAGNQQVKHAATMPASLGGAGTTSKSAGISGKAAQIGGTPIGLQEKPKEESGSGSAASSAADDEENELGKIEEENGTAGDAEKEGEAAGGPSGIKAAAGTSPGKAGTKAAAKAKGKAKAGPAAGPSAKATAATGAASPAKAAATSSGKASAGAPKQKAKAKQQAAESKSGPANKQAAALEKEEGGAAAAPGSGSPAGSRKSTPNKSGSAASSKSQSRSGSATSQTGNIGGLDTKPSGEQDDRLAMEISGQFGSVEEVSIKLDELKDKSLDDDGNADKSSNASNLSGLSSGSSAKAKPKIAPRRTATRVQRGGTTVFIPSSSSESSSGSDSDSDSDKSSKSSKGFVRSSDSDQSEDDSKNAKKDKKKKDKEGTSSSAEENKPAPEELEYSDTDGETDLYATTSFRQKKIIRRRLLYMCKLKHREFFEKLAIMLNFSSTKWCLRELFKIYCGVSILVRNRGRDNVIQDSFLDERTSWWKLLLREIIEVLWYSLPPQDAADFVDNENYLLCSPFFTIKLAKKCFELIPTFTWADNEWKGKIMQKIILRVAKSSTRSITGNVPQVVSAGTGNKGAKTSAQQVRAKQAEQRLKLNKQNLRHSEQTPIMKTLVDSPTGWLFYSMWAKLPDEEPFTVDWKIETEELAMRIIQPQSQHWKLNEMYQSGKIQVPDHKDPEKRAASGHSLDSTGSFGAGFLQQLEQIAEEQKPKAVAAGEEQTPVAKAAGAAPPTGEKGDQEQSPAPPTTLTSPGGMHDNVKIYYIPPGREFDDVPWYLEGQVEKKKKAASKDDVQKELARAKQKEENRLARIKYWEDKKQAEEEQKRLYREKMKKVQELQYIAYKWHEMGKTQPKSNPYDTSLKKYEQELPLQLELKELKERTIRNDKGLLRESGDLSPMRRKILEDALAGDRVKKQ